MSGPSFVLWSIAAVVAWGLTLPLTLELLVLSVACRIPARRKTPAAPGEFRLAVVVPAHNEQRLIGTCVRSLLAGDWTKVEIFVVAHNCTDQTAELAAAAGAEVLPLNGPGGKGMALDHGFREALARGAAGVLVIDADSVVSPNLLAEVAGALASGADAVQTRYEAANPETSVKTRLAALALVGMNVLRPLGRSRLGLSCGIFGNGFALSAATLARVPYTANSLVEDLEYHLRLVQDGLRVEFLNAATVYGEMPERAAAAATQRARWEGGRALMRREWSWPLAKDVACGNVRLLEPLLDLLSFPLAMQVGVLFLALMVPLGWVRVYAVIGLVTIVRYVLVSARLSPNPFAALRALAGAPAYLLWKLWMIPRTRLAARKDAAWVRTARNDDVPGDTVPTDPK
jgi:hypothetical protein